MCGRTTTSVAANRKKTYNAKWETIALITTSAIGKYYVRAPAEHKLYQSLATLRW